MVVAGCPARTGCSLIDLATLAPGPLAQVQRLLARCTFPAARSRLACAVSGGADSSALLVLAVAAGCQVTAHHVDHGLRPGSGGEAAVVAALAEGLGAGFVSHRVVVEPGPNLEARARAARYGVLPERIATGHTLDDRAETMLINLVRGAGRRGLSPLVDPERHPIVGLRRRDTLELAQALELDIVTDSTNSDARHQRNRMRAEVLPLLDDVATRDVVPVLARQAERWADEDALLDELASAIDVADAHVLAAAPPALARRAVRLWLRSAATLEHPPSAASIERVLAVAAGAAVATEIEGGHRVLRRNQCLRLEPPSLG